MNNELGSLPPLPDSNQIVDQLEEPVEISTPYNNGDFQKPKSGPKWKSIATIAFLVLLTLSVGTASYFLSSRVGKKEVMAPTAPESKPKAADLVDVGTGADGDITISGSININTKNSISGRGCVDGGDAPSYVVTTLTTNTATLSQTPSYGCLAAGDEVLLVNLQSAGVATSANLGNYETLRIQSISGSTITFTANKTKFYGSGAGSDSGIGTVKVMLQRVPNYKNVTVNGTLTSNSWDGSKGGVLAFKASGTVDIAGGITAGSLGYRGGGVSKGGESFCISTNKGDMGWPNDCGGGGGGGGGGGVGSGKSGSANSGGGGGGGGGANNSGNPSWGGAGGGGGFMSPGKAGEKGGNGIGYAVRSTDGGQNASGRGGDGEGEDKDHVGGGGGGGGTFKDDSGTIYDLLIMGTAGGGGGIGGQSPAGSGGNGGGIVLISANNFKVSGGTVSSSGAKGGNGTFDGGGGGGGAGGTIKLSAIDIDLGSSRVSASGGDGGNGGANFHGGDHTGGSGGWGGAGGNGKIVVEYVNTFSGVTSPTAITRQIGASTVTPTPTPTPTGTSTTPTPTPTPTGTSTTPTPTPTVASSAVVANYKKAYESEGNDEISTIYKGRVIVFKISAKNSSSEKVTGVSITDQFNEENEDWLEYQSADSRCSYNSDSRKVSCSVDIESGSTETIWIKTRVNNEAINGQILRNTGRVSYGGTETVSSVSLTVSGVVGCNHTCTSNDQCQSGLTCIDNSCRASACSSDTSCSCWNVTPTPTSTTTTTSSGSTSVSIADGSETSGTTGTTTTSTMPETGIVSLPGMLTLSGGLVLTVLGILLAL